MIVLPSVSRTRDLEMTIPLQSHALPAKLSREHEHKPSEKLWWIDTHTYYLPATTLTFEQLQSSPLHDFPLLCSKTLHFGDLSYCAFHFRWRRPLLTRDLYRRDSKYLITTKQNCVVLCTQNCREDGLSSKTQYLLPLPQDSNTQKFNQRTNIVKQMSVQVLFQSRKNISNWIYQKWSQYKMLLIRKCVFLLSSMIHDSRVVHCPRIRNTRLDHVSS